MSTRCKYPKRLLTVIGCGLLYASAYAMPYETTALHDQKGLLRIHAIAHPGLQNTGTQNLCYFVQLGKLYAGQGCTYSTLTQKPTLRFVEVIYLSDTGTGLKLQYISGSIDRRHARLNGSLVHSILGKGWRGGLHLSLSRQTGAQYGASIQYRWHSDDLTQDEASSRLSSICYTSPIATNTSDRNFTVSSLENLSSEVSSSWEDISEQPTKLENACSEHSKKLAMMKELNTEIESTLTHITYATQKISIYSQLREDVEKIQRARYALKEAENLSAYFKEYIDKLGTIVISSEEENSTNQEKKEKLERFFNKKIVSKESLKRMMLFFHPDKDSKKRSLSNFYLTYILIGKLFGISIPNKHWDSEEIDVHLFFMKKICKLKKSDSFNFKKEAVLDYVKKLEREIGSTIKYTLLDASSITTFLKDREPSISRAIFKNGLIDRADLIDTAELNKLLCICSNYAEVFNMATAKQLAYIDKILNDEQPSISQNIIDQDLDKSIQRFKKLFPNLKSIELLSELVNIQENNILFQYKNTFAKDLESFFEDNL